MANCWSGLFLSRAVGTIEHMFEYSDEGFVPIPAGLDEMAPGAELAAVLADTDVGAVSGYDRIVVLRAHQRLVSHYQAQVYADMAAIVDVFDEEDTDDLMWPRRWPPPRSEQRWC